MKVQNTSSSKTVRNVQISKESAGLIPETPIDLLFKKDGKQNRDLQPLCGELVVVFWKLPPRAGDASRETARALHGPIKIIASGDDVLPSECEFDYCPDQIPAIVQRGSSQGSMNDHTVAILNGILIATVLVQVVLTKIWTS